MKLSGLVAALAGTLGLANALEISHLQQDSHAASGHAARSDAASPSAQELETREIVERHQVSCHNRHYHHESRGLFSRIARASEFLTPRMLEARDQVPSKTSKYIHLDKSVEIDGINGNTAVFFIGDQGRVAANIWSGAELLINKEIEKATLKAEWHTCTENVQIYARSQEAGDEIAKEIKRHIPKAECTVHTYNYRKKNGDCFSFKMAANSNEVETSESLASTSGS